MQEYREFQLSKNDKNKFLEIHSTQNNVQEEEITIVKLSYDKKKIILGTSQGSIIFLNIGDFRVKLCFENQNKSRVMDFVEKQNFIGIGYQNGSITIYKKQFAFMNFSQYELKKPDDLAIRALKISEYSDHLIIIQEQSNELSFDVPQNTILQHDETLLERNNLILYNFKEMIEIGRTQLISFKCQNFELKKYFEFSKDCFVVRSPDFCSFRVHSLKNCQLISQGPDNIDASTIQFIKTLPDQQHLLVVSYNGDSYFFDLHGQEVIDPSNLQTPSYMVSPCGSNDLQLVSLPDRVQLFKFRKSINQQFTLFNKDEQFIYFQDNKDSFIIQLQPIKIKYKKIINGMISTDQTLFVYTYQEWNNQYMDITDLQSGNVLKTLKNHQPISTSFNSKFLICEDLIKNNLVRINLSTQKSEIIQESCGQKVVLKKLGDQIFYCDQDQKTQKYKLVIYDMKSKQVIGELSQYFDQEFSFQISNNEDFIILSTKNKHLLKIDCEDLKNLKILTTIGHEGGYSPNISFDLKDEYFICGGELSSDLHIYDLNTMNQIASIHNHTQPSSFGYFLSSNRIVTKQNDKLIYWKWNGKLEQLFEVNEESQIIMSFNKQMAGIVRNNEINLWNEELIHELSDSLSDIQPNNIRKQWIKGPLVLVYQLILNNFYSVSEQEKIKMLPHLLNYVVLPYGYTFLSKLIFSNQNFLVEEALKTKTLAYIRDINGNSPLIFALKRKDYQNIENILKFLGETKKYISQIKLNTWILLLQLAPSSLSPFLDNAIQIITNNFDSMGQKIDDESQNYFEQDSQSRVIPEQVYEKLLNQSAQEADKQPLQFTQSLININNQLGSKDSILLSQALEDCPDDKIFKNLFIDNMLKHKWSKMKQFANFLLVMQILFTLNVSIHSFTPGDPLWIHILSLQNYFWAIIELIIFVQSDFSLKYNSKLNIWLFILLQIYGSYTLESASPNIDKLLPLINWLAWFQLVTQLQQFELIRTFYCIFLGCITAIDGFCYFLLLMIFTFSTTQDIIYKNNDRAEKYGNDRGPYSVKFYEDHNITQTFDQNVQALWDAFFTTWVTIVKGDFSDSDAFVWRMFVLLSTFISNVVLLNLIIAFMSDSYGEVMSTVFEKKNKTLNYMTLRLEKVIFWKKNKGNRGFLIWVDYANEIKYMQANKTQELSEIVENKTQKCLNEFLKDQKIMFNKVQTQIVQTRQKLSNIINTQQNFQTQQSDKQQFDQSNHQFQEINPQINNQINQSNIQIDQYFSQTQTQLNQINKNLQSTLEAQQILQKQQLEMKNEFQQTKNQLFDHIAEQIVKTQIDNNNALNKQNEIQSEQINQLKLQINRQMSSQDKQEFSDILSPSLKKISSQIVQELKSNVQNQEIQFQGLIENFNQLKSNVLQSIQNSSINKDEPQESPFSSPKESKHRLRYKSTNNSPTAQASNSQIYSSQSSQKFGSFSLMNVQPEQRQNQEADQQTQLENRQENQYILFNQTQIPDKFSQIQSKVKKEINEKVQNHESQINEFINSKLLEILKQFQNKDQNRQDQLQNLLSQLNQTQYKIMIEANILIKNQVGNLQKLLTEKIVEIISQISQDIMLQLEQRDLGLKFERSDYERKQLSSMSKIQLINQEIIQQQKMYSQTDRSNSSIQQKSISKMDERKSPKK